MLDEPPFSDIGEYRLFSSARDATVPFDVTCAGVAGSGTLTGFSDPREGAIDCALEPADQDDDAAREVWATCPTVQVPDGGGA